MAWLMRRFSISVAIQRSGGLSVRLLPAASTPREGKGWRQGGAARSFGQPGLAQAFRILGRKRRHLVWPDVVLQPRSPERRIDGKQLLADLLGMLAQSR